MILLEIKLEIKNLIIKNLQINLIKFMKQLPKIEKDWKKE
jgi:hypothetical protein